MIQLPDLPPGQWWEIEAHCLSGGTLILRNSDDGLFIKLLSTLDDIEILAAAEELADPFTQIRTIEELRKQERRIQELASSLADVRVMRKDGRPV